MGPGSPWPPTRSGGESSSAWQLRPCSCPDTAPRPPVSTYHLEGAAGPSRSLWLLVALGQGGRQWSVSSKVSAPSSNAWGRGCWGCWTPSPQATKGSSWESAAGWGLEFHFPDSFPVGTLLLVTHSPWRPPPPGLPWAAGEPQSGTGSLGVAGVGSTARSVTVSTATCGGRKGQGRYQGQARDRPAKGPCVGGKRPLRPAESSLE